MPSSYQPISFGAGYQYRDERDLDIRQKEATIAGTEAATAGKLTQQADTIAKLKEWEKNAVSRASELDSKVTKAKVEADLAEKTLDSNVSIKQSEAIKKQAEAANADLLQQEKIETENAKQQKLRAQAVKASLPPVSKSGITDDVLKDNDPYNDWRAGLTKGELTAKTKESERELRKDREFFNVNQEAFLASRTAMQQLNDPNISTDALSNIKTTIGAYAAALHLPLPPKWDQAGQEVVRALGTKILAKQIQEGPRISDKDLAVMEKAQFIYTNSEDANRALLRYQEAVSTFQMERFNHIEYLMDRGALYRTANQDWTNLYGVDFVGVGVDSNNEIMTYFEYREAIRTKDARNNRKTDEKTIIENWKKRYARR